METDKKPTITQAGLNILKKFFRPRGVPDVKVCGPKGEEVTTTGPTIITGTDKHTEKVRDGQVSHKPDSDGQPT